MKRELRSVALLVALSCACTPDDAQVTTPDAAATEAAVVDTAIDSAPADVTADAPRPDAAPLDVAATDSTALDTAPIDAAPADTFATDVTRDARPLDAAPADIPSIDATADVRTDISAPTDTAPVDVARPDAAPAPPTFTTVFSTRSATNLPDGAIEDAIVDLINRAIPGSRVRVAVYTFTRNRVMTALVNAHRRGVDVKVVVDGGASSTPGSEVPSLMSGLGPTNVTVCRAPGTACLGTGIMHHKSYLFSALDDGSRDVVMQASHNLTNAQLSLHNNAVIVRGDAALFRAYERTFDDLRRDTAMPDYYRIDDGDLATRAYFFPRASGDTVVSIIDNATCDATSRILVAMAFFTDARIEVARSLAARREGGLRGHRGRGRRRDPPRRDGRVDAHRRGRHARTLPGAHQRLGAAFEVRAHRRALRGLRGASQARLHGLAQLDWPVARPERRDAAARGERRGVRSLRGRPRARARRRREAVASHPRGGGLTASRTERGAH